jgi:hypothetical protein
MYPSAASLRAAIERADERGAYAICASRQYRLYDPLKESMWINSSPRWF